MNWHKIAANFMVVFFATLITLNALGGVNAIFAAFVNASILGGLAASKEYLEQCGYMEKGQYAGLVLI